MEPQENNVISPSQGTYPVVGMTCAACAVSLESYLGSQKGVEKVVVSYPNQSVFVEYHSDLIKELDLARAAKEIGYELLMGDAQGGSEGAAMRAAQQLSTLQTKLVIAAICTTPIFVISMFFMNKIPHEGLIQCLLALPVIFFSGRDFYINAYKKLKHKQSNMDTLVALSTATAFIYSTYQTAIQYIASNHNHTNHPHFYFESATVIITLILLGKYLEERAKQRSSAAIKDLLSMQPTHATVVRNNEEIEIPTSDILLGDFVIIKPGSRIPVDGKVRTGDSYIDESAITGEPIPAHKTKGSTVS
jgi:Cu2+-exporting ATPase